MTQRISPKFWDFTWSGVDVADGLQAQSIYTEALASIIKDQGSFEAQTSVMQFTLSTGHAAQRAWMYMSDPGSRVVMVTPEQFKGLPRPENAWELSREVKPPFPITYFDLAGPSGLGTEIQLRNPTDDFPNSGKDWTAWLCGVIFMEHADALSVLPILRERKSLPNGLHVLVPAVVSYVHGEVPDGLTASDVGVLDGDKIAVPSIAHQKTASGQHPLMSNFLQAGTLADRCLPLLMLLESVNVDLAEAPLTPKQVRKAEQKKRKLPLVVAFRRSRKVYPRSAGEPKSHLTVQFEVIGHFKHHGEGTPIFKAALRDRPEKIRDYPRNHHRYGTGQCVRYWVPSHVKGPEDAPLVLKARRICGEDARRTPPEEDAA